MARQLKANGSGKGKGKANGAANDDGAPAEGPTRGHNIQQINASMLKGFREIYEIEQLIARLTEKHIQMHKDQRTKLWRNLKADTKIRRKVLKLKYDEYALARSTEDLESDEERNLVLDEMKIAHEALYPGQTIDMVEIIERVENAGFEADA